MGNLGGVAICPRTVDEARAVLVAASLGLTPGLISSNVTPATGAQLEAAIRVIARDEFDAWMDAREAAS